MNNSTIIRHKLNNLCDVHVILILGIKIIKVQFLVERACGVLTTNYLPTSCSDETRQRDNKQQNIDNTFLERNKTNFKVKRYR